MRGGADLPSAPQAMKILRLEVPNQRRFSLVVERGVKLYRMLRNGKRRCSYEFMAV